MEQKINKLKGRDSPSDITNLERAVSLCNIAMFTIDLQLRRLNSEEPEDRVFLYRQFADLHFMIVALIRLRRAAIIATNITDVSTKIKEAISSFDKALYMLKDMRDVQEHIDEYAINKGNLKKIDRTQLQVGVLTNNTIYEWLGKTFDANIARSEAVKLYEAVKKAFDDFRV
ncbi:hypothetical protein [Emticicia sp. 21SJ11W-3]|uniref:hypothetical protein n=1 Tax=Emticicia sp. 21SJ11W-3 TaxID=2916755 RepID=UPI00209F8F6F|nr:hypothetical protein [Emticicia sp. 21SJ11W-3]UTA70173.1 hypothetical protein MB380_10200 [Emticicia sp. 21SJ11W-3]